MYQKVRITNKLENQSEFFSVTNMIIQKSMEDEGTYKKIKDSGEKYFVYIYSLVIIISAVF